MLYVACGKLVVTRLKETWPADLALLLEAYDSRGQGGQGGKGGEGEGGEKEAAWDVSRLVAQHVEEYPQAESLWSRLPGELTTLISACLAVDPTQRPTVAELLATSEYTTLLAARQTAIDTLQAQQQQQQLTCTERDDLHRQIADLTEQSAAREERMIFLETVLAEERAGHFRTADLLQEESEKLREALEKIAQLEAGEGVEKEEEVPVPQVVGQHHPGKRE